MIKLEEKEYELGKFFQFDPLLKYLDALNQSHNDLKDLVSKLQLQLENKDRKVIDFEEYKLTKQMFLVYSYIGNKGENTDG